MGGTKRISNIGTIENFDKIKNVQYGEHKKQLEPEHEAEEDFSRHWREPPEAGKLIKNKNKMCVVLHS